jgi:hypothetical protein
MNNELKVQTPQKATEKGTRSENMNDTLQLPVAALPQGWPTSPVSETPVYWVKSNFYRTINVDGMFGGPSPTPGRIIMGIYSHHLPYPEFTLNDQAGKELIEKRLAKFGVEHELEASLSVDINTAKHMVTWLQSAIANAETFMAAASSMQQQAAKNNL